MWEKLHLPLRLKLLAGFITVILVLSLFHLFSYASLLSSMGRETRRTATERLTSAAARLDASLSQIRNDYFSLTYTAPFRQARTARQVTAYEMVDLREEAQLYFSNTPCIDAFAILFRNSDDVVTSSGNYEAETFFSRYYANETYTTEFWQAENAAIFSQRCYPAAYFSENGALSNDTSHLLPLAFKPFRDGNMMVLLFIDIEELCREADLYLTEGFYIFDAQTGGTLLNLDAENRLSSMPESETAFASLSGGGYITRQPSGYSDLVYVKLLDESAVQRQIQNSLAFTLVISLVAVALALAVAVVFVRQLMHPVREILHLFGEGNPADQPQQNELDYIQAHVEQIVRQRDQYVQQLTRKDQALSGFLLQTQLKNMYVDLDEPDATEPAASRTFFILYCRAHYRRGALEGMTYSPQTVALLLQEILNQELNKLFDTSLIFQLEPNQFVAKVGVPAAQTDLSAEMANLMQRLENEREFAFFTVVQSEPLPADGDFAAVYTQVLDAARYAVVSSETQLLRLPLQMQSAGRFRFSDSQEQQLRSLVQEGKAEEARALACQVLEDNIARGIRRIHMILLGSTMTGAAVRALSELYSRKEPPNLGSGRVYSALPNCDTGQDYIELVGGFVYSAAQCAKAEEGGTDPILEGVRRFLAENYQREFSMDELADTLHLSKNYLSTYFKGKTGTNLSDHIQFYRVQKAIDLLRNPDHKIGDICGMVGIGNINTFLRQFKKYTGMTPKKYRQHKLPPV